MLNIDKEASIFVFEKRVADKLHKPKRKETITEILRFSVRQLDKLKHPKYLTFYHPIEESSYTLAFAAEPVTGSLANVLGYLEERLPQTLPSATKEYSFLPLEIKYGLLQLAEGLSFLHYSCKLIHRNVCPQSVIINKRGTWKLAGLEFTERCNETDPMTAVPCQPFTSKLPKMGQPDLDFTAPEIQFSSMCSPYSDMFSFGLLICSVFNNGRSLIEANLSTTTYSKQLDLLEQNLTELLDRIPHHLQEPVQSVLNIDPTQRASSQDFTMIKYFMDPSVYVLQYLDAIHMKDTTHKSHFYHSLKGALPNIPRKLWYQHVLPSLSSELQSSEVLAAALKPLLFVIEESSFDQYQTLILPTFRSVFGMPKSVQASVTLLEHLDVIMKKTSKDDIKSDILPLIYTAFDSTTPQIQSAALHALSQVAGYLDENAVRKTVLPRTKQFFDNHSGTKEDSVVHVQANALMCIEKIIDKLEKTDILDEVLPMLNKAKLHDPLILMPVVRIYKHMLGDKRYGLTVNLLATKVMPALIPVTVSPGLKLDQFTTLVELLQEMLDHVSKSQKNKIKLEKLTTPSIEENPSNHLVDQNIGYPQRPPSVVQNIGYPQRPPSLRLDSRRTSMSMEDVIQEAFNNSTTSSPDSNLLRVQAALPGRRHSDNTIQPPRILVAPSSPESHLSRGPSAGNLQTRRHSSANTQDINLTFTTPKTLTTLGVDHLTTTSQGGRRYSATALYESVGGGVTSAGSSTSLLKQIGSGVYHLFSSK
ncbi:SCY1-like protein 2 [Tachypleus tridentatus]|uniref:SCY1-like protein 2 n=1 Tax=Tachypleus tridentatus TaxID=6853 RepID=UPI003FD38067